MKAQMQQLIIYSLLALALCFPALSSAEELDSGPSLGAIFADVVLARPALFAITAVGTALYVVTLPVTLLTGNAGDAGDALVMTPAAATFTRCLGCTNKDKYRDTFNYTELSSHSEKNAPKRFYLKGGYQSSTYFSEDSGSGFNVTLGGKLFESNLAFVDLELSYLGFGEASDDSTFDDGSRQKSSLSLTSLGLGTNLGINLGNHVQLYAKAGVSKWDIEAENIDYEPNESPETSKASESGQDAYLGAGVAVNVTENISISAEYIVLSLTKIKADDNKVTSVGANLALRF
jgi:opacity protein-like surface antigen